MVSWKGIYFILTLFCGSFFGSIFMLGPFLPLMFVSPSWYRWINNRLVATWLTLPVALLETMFGIKVIITGDAFVPGERSVIIMNHRTRMDWLFLWNCLMRYSYLRLEKICLKASLKSVPGFGWAMQAAAYIFIHRKWKDDQSHFEDIIDYFCDIREPLQLLIFPEGTDLTENSKARSNDFAEKNGLQKYEYVLHPRTTGFTFVVERLREGKNLDAVHDITVAYPHNIPQTERHLLLGDFPKEIHFHVHRNEPSTPSRLVALHSEQLRVRLSLAHASHWTLFRSFEDQLSGLQNVYGTVSPTVQSLPFRNIVNKANVVCMGCEPLYLK
ncbi:lysocardiolipin acyltransferase 1 isoform X2 [Mirounga angustirostris]|uniref:lysocardiolipin acyltransferase 1 isoform X2 n=1 Tax=Mirounga leonina TaxID=9715 RepID=UPI00156BFCA4|nr:lysocardiolipin acyltransferase 1 isoform X2 [Mirounga leonina]XP_054365652.1 lysocardiolipin acyltransferase 1 isoform X2 [Mirounga angustirostris]